LSILGIGGSSGSSSPLSVLGDLVSELGGTVLAGALTAVGLPELVPIASSVAKALGGALQGAASSSSSASSGSTSTSKPTTSKSSGSNSAKSSSSSTTASPSETEAGDERMDMLEIQRMVEKQNQMFQLISNVLAGMNDTALNVISNVR
jgi:type IV secretory pathway TrbL component